MNDPLGIPPDFGGVVGGWAGDGSRAFLMRYGKGQLQSAMRLTPVNLWATYKTCEMLISEGRREGFITDEHVAQMQQLYTGDLGSIPPREKVDQLLGED